MFELIKLTPRTANNDDANVIIELLEEALRQAKDGTVSGAVIILGCTDSAYMSVFHVGESFAALVTGTLDVQRRLLAHNEG